MNIGDSKEEARAAFGDYISKYYPELSQAMDLSNWGPVGTPEEIAAWLREFSDRGVRHFICRFGAIDQFGQVERFAREVLPAFQTQEVLDMTVNAEQATPSAEAIRKDAELVVDVCMSVEADDVVTIICDDDNHHLARVVADVCVDRGAWPVVMNNEMQVRRGRADTHFPMAPPRNLHQAMVSSDEVIIITNLEWANRFAHVSAVKETCAANGKIASVEPGMGELGTDRGGAPRAQQRAWDAMAALEGVERVRVTSAKGTDFTVTIKDRPALEVTSIKKRGQMMGPLPAVGGGRLGGGRGRTEGTVVVDGVMLGIGLPGQVTEPITWTSKGQGGQDRGRRRRAAAARGRRRRRERDRDRRVRVRGQRGCAVWDAVREGPRRDRAPALGDNHNAYPGGQNVSVLHLDGVVLDASMQIVDNGRWIIKDGEWCCSAARTAHGRSERCGGDPASGGSLDRWSSPIGRSARTASSLGYSVFTPGCVTAMVCHEVEEVAYVISGRGELRLQDGATVPFEADQGLFVPAGVWHAVANTGEADVVMVFGFPYPDYPDRTQGRVRWAPAVDS